MRVSAKGGPPVLDKGEATRMMETVWIIRALERDQPDTTDRTRVLAAADVIEGTAKKFGAGHFEADGTLKESVKRKKAAAEAPAP